MDSKIADKIEAFFGQYPLQKYKKGQILIHAGDQIQQIIHVVSGQVKQYDLSYRGDEVVLNVFKPPAFFPMSNAINGTPNEYFFEADSEVELKKAPVDDVVKFIHDQPDVLYDLLARVYRGADGLLRRTAHLMASTAKSRVMFELIIECRRFGIPEGDGFLLKLSESDLGVRSGLSRETVNREIHKLKAEGLVSAGHRQIVIPDLARLEQSLGKDL